MAGPRPDGSASSWRSALTFLINCEAELSQVLHNPRGIFAVIGAPLNSR
jgi:hypothetical protein